MTRGIATLCVVWMVMGWCGAAGPQEPGAPPPPATPKELNPPSFIAGPGFPNPAPPEAARRHLVRGTAAMEMAKSDAELAPAAEEFAKAIAIAPEWPVAWYNLAGVQAKLGRLPEAMASYRKFLALAPGDREASRVEDELIKLEFRMEKAAVISGRSGTWVERGGAHYEAVADGDQLILRSRSQWMSPAELSANTFFTKVPAPPLREYKLELRGAKVAGTSSRSEVMVGKCLVPQDQVEVAGTYDPAQGRLNLQVPRTKYEANTRLNLFLDPVECSGVNIVNKDMAEVTFHGPLPPAGIGVQLDTVYYPGGILIRYEWSGHLGVGAVLGEPAKAAGLRAGDEILGIDGTAVSTLTAGEAVYRIYGPAGKEILLQVLHRKEKVPVEIRLNRFATQEPAAKPVKTKKS